MVQAEDELFTGWQALDLECAVVVADAGEGVIQGDDIGAHPGVDVAVDRDRSRFRLFDLDRLLGLRRNRDVLSLVGKEVHVGVVPDIVGVGDLQRIAGLQQHDSRFEAALVIGQFIGRVGRRLSRQLRAATARENVQHDVFDALVFAVDQQPFVDQFVLATELDVLVGAQLFRLEGSSAIGETDFEGAGLLGPSRCRNQQGGENHKGTHGDRSLILNWEGMVGG